MMATSLGHFRHRLPEPFGPGGEGTVQGQEVKREHNTGDVARYNG